MAIRRLSQRYCVGKSLRLSEYNNNKNDNNIIIPIQLEERAYHTTRHERTFLAAVCSGETMWSRRVRRRLGKRLRLEIGTNISLRASSFSFYTFSYSSSRRTPLLLYFFASYPRGTRTTDLEIDERPSRIHRHRHHPLRWLVFLRRRCVCSSITYCHGCPSAGMRYRGRLWEAGVGSFIRRDGGGG